MILDSEVVQHRIGVIQALESFGLKIHGVVTPSDILWNNTSIPPDILSAEKAREYIDAALINNKPGTAYEIALNEVRTRGTVSKRVSGKGNST